MRNIERWLKRFNEHFEAIFFSWKDEPSRRLGLLAQRRGLFSLTGEKEKQKGKGKKEKGKKEKGEAEWKVKGEKISLV